MTGRELREGIDGSPGAVVYGRRYPPEKSLLILRLCQLSVRFFRGQVLLTLRMGLGIVLVIECSGFGEGSCMVVVVEGG